MGLAALGLVVAGVLNRAGKWQWSARTALPSLLLTAILLAIQARDGFRSHAMLLFPGLLLISVMLLDRAWYCGVASSVLVAVAAVGIAERHGLTEAVPGVRSPTTFESIFFVDLTLLVFAVIGRRIVSDAQSNVTDLHATIDQVTATNLELVKSVEAMRASELRYRQLHESIRDAIATVDMAGAILECNPAFEAMLGYSTEELRKMAYRDLTPERWHEVEQRILSEQVLTNGQSEVYEKEYCRRDGTVVPVELRTVLVRDGGGQQPTGMWAIIRDITERKRADRELVRQNEFIRAALDNIYDGVVACDADGNLALFNRAACEWHGTDALKLPPEKWSSYYDLFGPDGKTPLATDSVPLKRAFNGEQVRDVAMTIASKGQPMRHLLASGRPFYGHQGHKLGAVVAMHDITERKRAEAERERLQQQLAHAQKMESVGRLAGGIAHDFNNLLSVIVMHTESTLDELNSGDPAKESVTAIQDAAQKAVALGRQLMAFSQKQAPQTELLDLNSVIGENHKMIRRLIGEDVKVVFNPGPRLLVRADRGQLGQVIMNLAVNSRDAMPQGGVLEIQTCGVEFNEEAAQLNPGARSGLYAILIVRDNGIGMDAETRARLFEPFFTTKGVGKGTGLGLSVVYGMISQAGGFITVASEQGKGTEFKVHLPVAGEAPKRVSEIEENGRVPGGSETILLTEDEPALRDKVRKVLVAAGYRVLAAPDGTEALRLILENDAIHLLVTDVVMPEISGFRLAERLRSLRPQTKVLYMSGYPDQGDKSGEAQPGPNLIQKPFTKEKLLRTVREALDSAKPDE